MVRWAMMVAVWAVAAGGAAGQVRLVAEPGRCAVMWGEGQVLAESAGKPIATIHYTEEPDMWKCRSWRELQPDRTEVDRRSGRITVPSFGGLPVRMTLTPTVDTRRREIRWAVEVRSDAPGTVVAVTAPMLRGIATLPDDALYLPDRPGQKMADPWPKVADSVHSIDYPVPASMQYVAYAGKPASGAAGLALMVLDPAMGYKGFHFGGPDRELSPVQFPFLMHGKTWRSPAVVWQVLPRGWHDAADRYREWFDGWAPKPQTSPQILAMPVMGGTVVRSRPVDDPNLRDVLKRQEVGTYDAALKQALELKQRGFDGTQLIGWFGQGHDTTYPDHLPSEAMGGSAGMHALVDGMHAQGLIASFYLNARLANYNSDSLKAHPDWEVLKTGERYREHYGDQDFTVMCPATEGFRKHMIGEAMRIAAEYHGDGVQLDQIGAAPSLLCFNPEHGHSTPATAWGEGYPRMLREMRSACRAVNPRFWLWNEGAWEGSGCYVDMAQGGFWQSIPGSVAFPQMYAYTHPTHLLFGDPLLGGVPYWPPRDIGRTKRIYAAAKDLFRSLRFMDDVGLSVDGDAEAHWWTDGKRALVTVLNRAGAERSLELRLTAGRTGLPRSAKALASGAAVVARADTAGAGIVLPVTVPAGQVEAILLEW